MIGLAGRSLNGRAQLTKSCLKEKDVLVPKQSGNLTRCSFKVVLPLERERTGTYDSWIMLKPMLIRRVLNTDTVQNNQGHPIPCDMKPPMIRPIAAPRNGANVDSAKDLPRLSTLHMSAMISPGSCQTNISDIFWIETAHY